MQRSVTCQLTAEVLDVATVELQVALAGVPPLGEQLQILLNGVPVMATELATEAGGRLHVLRVEPGWLEVSYTAQVLQRANPELANTLDTTTYLRPSRYAESDRLAAVAHAEFGSIGQPMDLLGAVAGWVGHRLSYVPGSSSGTDGATETLLAGAGVCRDFSHLAIAFLRACDVPARLVAVYAPGLYPMDFHAVVEALVHGVWYVVDPTLLAPRSSLMRIATGRDAADTAFLSSYGGDVRLDSLDVRALVDGYLPLDDLSEAVRLG